MSGSESSLARVASGIPGLDEMLGGGARVGQGVVVSGRAGTGLTWCGLQSLLGGVA